MNILETLRAQHQLVLKTLDDLERALSGPDEHAATLRALALTARLERDLGEHLLAEEAYLYPLLARRGQAEVRGVAAQFAEESRGVRACFAAFFARWPRAPVALGARFPDFVSEVNVLLRALRYRIAREEAELFPLAATFSHAA